MEISFFDFFYAPSEPRRRQKKVELRIAGPTEPCAVIFAGWCTPHHITTSSRAGSTRGGRGAKEKDEANKQKGRAFAAIKRKTRKSREQSMDKTLPQSRGAALLCRAAKETIEVNFDFR